MPEQSYWSYVWSLVKYDPVWLFGYLAFVFVAYYVVFLLIFGATRSNKK